MKTKTNKPNQLLPRILSNPMRKSNSSLAATFCLVFRQSPSDAINGLCRLVGLLALCLFFGVARTANAQTTICGTINTATWTPTGNPYIIGCDSTVPSGQTLTIQPGVVVWLGSSVTLTVNGSIQARGIPGANPANRVVFRTPVPSQYWNRIQLNYSGATNRFTHCDFQNADTAISMRVYAGNYIMNAEIMNCTFSNCRSTAIYGEAQGRRRYDSGDGNAFLDPLVKNCVFNNVSNGCVFVIFGENGSYPRYGYSTPRIAANLFQNLSGTAFLMGIGGWAGSGSPIFINNTMVNCRTGVESQEPWDARIQDNIFVGATNAVKKSGSLSLTTSHNDFCGNATNFTGYPPLYGSPIIPNCNGNLADLFFNIYEDPQFLGSNDFRLATNSPCIDACMPDTAFYDVCFPPSLGTPVPDMGAYGGPDAANWMDVVPKLPVTASLSNSNNVTRLNWSAIPRSEYQVQYTTNLVSVGTNTWLNFPNGRVLATEKPTSIGVATNTSASKMFFRIQSLGRAPGN